MKSEPDARTARGSAGFTYVELMVTAAVLVVVASALMPLAHWAEKRRREAHLRVTLQTMRDAIDQYHKYAEQGLIVQTDVEQLFYPRTLDELVDGVEVSQTGTTEARTIKFLQRMPIDPITGESEWGQRSYQDAWDNKSWGGENIYDVYSLSDLRALDDTYYHDW